MADDDGHGNAKLDSGDLADLLRLLHGLNLSASDRFTVEAPQLRRSLGEDLYMSVRKQIDCLQFAEAASALEHLVR